MFPSDRSPERGSVGEAGMSSFLFIAITVVLTALAAWFFGTGVGRSRERELSESGHAER